VPPSPQPERATARASMGQFDVEMQVFRTAFSTGIPYQDEKISWAPLRFQVAARTGRRRDGGYWRRLRPRLAMIRDGLYCHPSAAVECIWFGRSTAPGECWPRPGTKTTLAPAGRPERGQNGTRMVSNQLRRGVILLVGGKRGFFCVTLAVFWASSRPRRRQPRYCVVLRRRM